MEKTADEMFEEFGYRHSRCNNCDGYINEQGSAFFLFIADKKAVNIHIDDTEYPAFSMQELQAINKKCQELGWI